LYLLIVLYSLIIDIGWYYSLSRIGAEGDWVNRLFDNKVGGFYRGLSGFLLFCVVLVAASEASDLFTEPNRSLDIVSSGAILLSGLGVLVLGQIVFTGKAPRYLFWFLTIGQKNDVVDFNVRRINKDGVVELKPGESLDKGFCPRCGDVAVFTCGKGYHPSIGSVLIHIVLSIVTSGFWLFVWVGYMISASFRKGKGSCVQCGQVLHED